MGVVACGWAEEVPFILGRGHRSYIHIHHHTSTQGEHSHNPLQRPRRAQARRPHPRAPRLHVPAPQPARRVAFVPHPPLSTTLTDPPPAWTLYDPLNAACLALGPPPPALAPYARFAPGNRRVLEYTTPYRLETSVGSLRRSPVLRGPSVRSRRAPAALRAAGVRVEYTPDGPRLRGA